MHSGVGLSGYRALHTRSMLSRKCALLRRSHQRRIDAGEILAKGKETISNILSENPGVSFNDILRSNRIEGALGTQFRARRIHNVDPEVLYYINYHSKRLPSGGKYDSRDSELSEEDKTVLYDAGVGDSLMVGTLRRPVYDFPMSPRLVLCLDGVIFPENVGGLIRCSHALGVDGIVATPGTCDYHGWKVLEASRGFGFNIPQVKMKSTDELIQLILDKNLLPIVGHAAEGVDATQLDMRKHKGVMVIVGNEKHGPSREILDLAVRVRIPISQKTNSLNATVAGGLLLQLVKAVVGTGS